MDFYGLGQKFINDRFNSGDAYYLSIEIGLQKDALNRNIFIIQYIPENFGQDTTTIIEKNYSIKKMLEKYGFDENDSNGINGITIKQAVKNVLDYRKRKINYL